jgi:hypothetical protein
VFSHKERCDKNHGRKEEAKGRIVEVFGK